MYESPEESHRNTISPTIHIAPSDRLNLAYIFLLFHGIGFLLPWNVFINAKEYFVDYKLNTTTSIEADYRVNFMSYIGFAAQFPGVCFAAWNIFCHSGPRTSNPVFRFVVAMVMEIVILCFTIILAIVDTSHMPGTFFALTIISVVVLNCCVGIHQTLTFGMAAVLPMKYSNAVIIGANACGTIISIVNILTKGLAAFEGRTPNAIVGAVVAYFFVATMIVVGCLVTYFWLRQLEFVRFHAEASVKHLCIPVDCNPIDCSAEDSILKPPKDDVATTTTTNDIAQSSSQSSSFIPRDLDQIETISLLTSPRDRTGFDSPESPHTASSLRKCFGICCFKPPHGKRLCSNYWLPYYRCFSECWSQCLNIWAVFFCSLSMFPAIQSMVKPVDPGYFISPVWFTDITCFLTFNLFSVFGSLASNWLKFPGPRYLWIPILFRMIFFTPFFLFSNFGLESPYLPVLVLNDHLYVFGCVLFAFTNGYLSSLAVMNTPGNCPPERSELAGMYAAFFLILGVCSGVYASRGFAALVF